MTEKNGGTGEQPGLLAFCAFSKMLKWTLFHITVWKRVYSWRLKTTLSVKQSLAKGSLTTWISFGLSQRLRLGTSLISPGLTVQCEQEGSWELDRSSFRLLQFGVWTGADSDYEAGEASCTATRVVPWAVIGGSKGPLSSPCRVPLWNLWPEKGTGVIPGASIRKCLPGESYLHNGASLLGREDPRTGQAWTVKFCQQLCQHMVDTVEVLLPTL